jgi:putative endonuclease
MTNKEIGQTGEDQACRYVIDKGYQIIGRNWRCPYGEIDIIARDQQTLVFIEVKARRQSIDNAWEAITPAKRQRMIDCAHAYLSVHESDNQVSWRIDVIAVHIAKGRVKIEHGEDALGW